MRQHIFSLDIWWIAILSMGIFTPDISKNIHLWLSLMKRCRKILLAHDASWVYASENDGWMKNMRASSRKNNLSIDPVLTVQIKSSRTRREFTREFIYFARRTRGCVCVRSGAKVIPLFCSSFFYCYRNLKIGSLARQCRFFVTIARNLRLWKLHLSSRAFDQFTLVRLKRRELWFPHPIFRRFSISRTHFLVLQIFIIWSRMWIAYFITFKICLGL